MTTHKHIKTEVVRSKALNPPAIIGASKNIDGDPGAANITSCTSPSVPSSSSILEENQVIGRTMGIQVLETRELCDWELGQREYM